MDCMVHGVTKSQTQLSNFHFTSLHFTSFTNIFHKVNEEYNFQFKIRNGYQKRIKMDIFSKAHTEK